MNDKRLALVLAVLVIALGLVIGMADQRGLPVDEHEALVLGSARAMLIRDDWVVPYFNDAPRLKKPPMNYWLTALVARAAGAGAAVEPWHGRVVSLAAGLGVLALTGLLGMRFYDRPTALLAMALLATSAAYFSYTHDARPDLLYTFLCMAGFAAFALAWRADGAKRGTRVYLMWLAYAGAVLTKGPQVPAMLLLAQGIWLVRGAGGGWRALARLRPAAGLAVLLALTLPWWWLLQQRLPAGALAESQLGGSLLRPGFGHLFNGYYFYRPLQLVLPWLPLLPLAWVVAWRERGSAAAGTRLLGLTLLITVLGFSLGPQQRFYYLLPVLPLMVLPGARGVRVLAAGGSGWGTALLALQGAIALAAVALLYQHGAGLAALTLLLAVAAVVAGVFGVLTRSWRSGLASALIVLVAGAFIQHASSKQLWSSDRLAKHQLAQELKQLLGPSDQVLSMQLTNVVYVFEIARTIHEVTSPKQVLAILEGAGGSPVYLLAEFRREPELKAALAVSRVASMPPGSDDRAALYRVTGAARKRAKSADQVPAAGAEAPD